VLETDRGRDRQGSAQVNGRRVVHHPALGDFRDEFSIVAPWISSVIPGATLQVLVAPRERKTWLTLGAVDENPA
jgi:hypothetical protein